MMADEKVVEYLLKKEVRLIEHALLFVMDNMAMFAERIPTEELPEHASKAEIEDYLRERIALLYYKL